MDAEERVDGYTETEIREYMRRLGAYAAERLTRSDLRSMREEVGTFRHRIPGHDDGLDAAHFLSGSLVDVRTILHADSFEGTLARFTAPLDLVVPRVKREAIMRSVAGPLIGHGVSMAHRWATNTALLGWADAMVEHTLAAVGDARDDFTRFVRRTLATRWMISADFCIGDKTKHNDVFAFTIHPVEEDPRAVIKAAQDAVPRDYKDTSRAGLRPEALAYLADERRFTFAFMPTRQRSVFPDVRAARTAIEETITRIAERHDAERHTAEAARWKALRQEANANAFNFRKLENMALAAVFAGTISMLLAGEGRAEAVLFVPDRDAMTRAYDRMMTQLYPTNAWAFTLRRRYPPPTFHVGIEDESVPEAAPWFDPLIRIPDFVAGVLAGMDFDGPRKYTRPKRDIPLVRNVLADNRNLVVVRFPELTREEIRSDRLMFRRHPLAS
jgi:hypothetical protein